MKTRWATMITRTRWRTTILTFLVWVQPISRRIDSLITKLGISVE
nr:hypothetical protein [Fibrobacter intestinalis]